MTRLNFENIENLIENNIKESSNLDYKRELSNHNTEIAKDISSFANASGGKIIYGVDEKNELPHSINWINTKGVKERIENIILSNIQPEIKGYDIYSVENPDNDTKAIFIVEIPESPYSPHMGNHRYYIRRNCKSEPMEDSEVKYAIFKKGLKKALEFEIEQNIELSEKTFTRLEKYIDYHTKHPVPVLLVPLYDWAWKSVVSSGTLFVFKDDATNLVSIYRQIHEINYLIEYLRYEKSNKETSVYTPIEDSNPEFGTSILWIIRTEIVKLIGELRKIKLE